MAKLDIDVPCNGCTQCCKHWDMLRLLPGDDPLQYKTEPHPLQPGALMIAHKDNGDCYYLGDNGCTIHDRRPQMCRSMDCRNFPIIMDKSKAKEMGIYHVWKAGKNLLKKG